MVCWQSRQEELSTGIKSSVQVKPSYGLTDDEITRMLKDSLSHATDDRDMRRLRGAGSGGGSDD